MSLPDLETAIQALIDEHVPGGYLTSWCVLYSGRIGDDTFQGDLQGGTDA